jgi:hypothetical protein
VTDTLPITGVTFVSASQTPDSINGRELEFEIGNLAAGASKTITITVVVAATFEGELYNTAHVEGNEPETNLNNNDDDETTLVEADPSSIGGTVYVDRNNNGVHDSGEGVLSGVIVTLKGIDAAGATVIRTTTTNASGNYLFDELNAGTYRIIETQPTRYKDGKDAIGSHGGYLGEEPGPFIIPNDVSSDEVKDLFIGIELGTGIDATDYDFGEQAVSISKRNFLSR